VHALVALFTLLGIGMTQGQPIEVPNDLFENRLPLEFNVPVRSSFSGTGLQPDEPDRIGDWRAEFPTHHPVWWQWTSDVSNLVSVVVSATYQRPLVSVFVGDALTNLHRIGTLTFQNPTVRDGTNFYATEVQFQALPGTNYVIEVDNQVPLTLGWDGPAESDISGYRLFRSTITEPFAVIDVGNTTNHSIWDLQPDTFYSFVVTAYSLWGFESDFSTELLLVSPSGVQDSDDYEIRLVQPPSIYLSTPVAFTNYAAGTDVPLECSIVDGSEIERVEYSFQLQYGDRGEVTVATSTNAPFNATWTNAPVGRYFISARAYSKLGASGLSAPVLVTVGAPANDLFRNRTVLTAGVPVEGLTVAAGKEDGEPLLIGGDPVLRTVWWSWTATSNRPTAVVVTMPNHPPRLAVFTGSALGTLVETTRSGTSYSVLSNDVLYFTRTIDFTPQAGRAYRIVAGETFEDPFSIVITDRPGVSITSPSTAGEFPTNAIVPLQADAFDGDGQPAQVTFCYASADGRNGVIGTVTNIPFGLLWDSPQAGSYSLTAIARDRFGAETTSAAVPLIVGRAENDSFENPFLIPTFPISTNQNAHMASLQSSEPKTVSDRTIAQSVWWRWTADHTGPCSIVVSTGSKAAIAGVYVGTIVTNLTRISNFHTNNAISALPTTSIKSQINFNATLGTTYSILVDSSGEAYSLALTQPPTVKIASPVSPADFTPLSAIPFLLDTSDADGSVTRVEYFYSSETLPSQLLGHVEAAPFSLIVSNLERGIYKVTVRAIDNLDAVSFSLPITVYVGRPVNDFFSTRPVLSESPFTVNGSTIAASHESGEPVLSSGGNGHTVWWRWTAPRSGIHLLSVRMPDVQPIVGIFSGSTLQSLSLVDSSQSVESFLEGLTNIYLAHCRFSAIAGQTYSILVDVSWGPGTDFTMSLNAVPVCNLLTPPDRSDFAPGSDILLDSTAIDPDGEIMEVTYLRGIDETPVPGVALNAPYTIIITNAAPGNYLIVGRAVDDLGTDGFSPPVEFTVGGVTNDLFANRLPLVGNSVTIVGDNSIAMPEPGEPSHAGQNGHNSVWWSWTAPDSGDYLLSSAGSSFSSLLGVYNGTSLTNLVHATGWYQDFTSDRLILEATEGTIYQIAVDGLDGRYGQIILTIDKMLQPTNDNFDARAVIPGIQAVLFANNGGATAEPDETARAASLAARSLWWTWTAPASGFAQIDWNGSQLDTVVGVYIGSTLTNLTLVAEGPDAGAALQDQIDFRTTANTVYQIAVDGRDGAAGAFFFNFGFAPDPLTITGLAVSNAEIVLHFESSEGGRVIVEYSNNLRDWFPLSTNIVTSNCVIFVDPDFGDQNTRFYRAILDLTLRSVAIENWSESQNAFSFEIPGSEGGLLTIEASEDLIDWTSLSTNTVLNGKVLFTDPDRPLHSKRFYRAARTGLGY
jgi:Bacterial Ig domain/Fibronectin type III domain